MEAKRITGLNLKDSEFTKIVNKENKLDQEAIMVKRMLYNKYPRNLSKKDLERVQEE